MGNPAGSYIWYELMTPDPAGAKAFYDKVVGWDMGTESVAPGIEYRMIKRSDGGNAGGVLTLTEDMIAKGAIPAWYGYIHTSNVDASVKAMTADGATVLMPPWDQPGVGRLAMVEDPTGAPFYLMDPLPPEGAADATSDVFSVDDAEHVRWNELSTTDQDRAIEFYTGHLGWTQEGSMPMGEFGDYEFVQCDGVGIGAIMRKMPQSPSSQWVYYVGVDDIDRAASAITDGGGSVVNGPMDIPGGEYALVGLDPQGAVFGLVGPRKA